MNRDGWEWQEDQWYYADDNGEAVVWQEGDCYGWKARRGERERKGGGLTVEKAMEMAERALGVRPC